MICFALFFFLQIQKKLLADSDVVGISMNIRNVARKAALEMIILLCIFLKLDTSQCARIPSLIERMVKHSILRDRSIESRKKIGCHGVINRVDVKLYTNIRFFYVILNGDNNCAAIIVGVKNPVIDCRN